jgi:hypothetical protein
LVLFTESQQNPDKTNTSPSIRMLSILVKSFCNISAPNIGPKYRSPQAVRRNEVLKRRRQNRERNNAAQKFCIGSEEILEKNPCKKC